MSIHRKIIPPIKCHGIKTKLIPWIRAILPHDFEGRWIEPFMGSGVVAFNIRPRKASLGDSNPHLINFYKAISVGKITAHLTREYLEREGELLLKTEGKHYYTVRSRFNESAEPLDFLFLNRAGFNGMIRFNRKSGFNVPFCRKPNRFAPAYITKICNQVQIIADACALGDYDFVCQDYLKTISEPKKDDLLYCDPPYIDRHTDYFKGWDEEHERCLGRALAKNARFILSTWHSNEHREQHLNTKTFLSRWCQGRESKGYVGGSGN